jgi:hypothetical protein
MKTIRIPISGETTNISFNLEQDFDDLEILSLKMRSDDVYSKVSSDFGVLVGRVTINGGFGVSNAKVSVFIPLEDSDIGRQEIVELYPFKSISDSFPDGLRYNLLPRIKQSNISHVPVGTFPDVSDLSAYGTYVEIFEKYYKYTTTTNESGDYMIYGIPLGIQNVHMDFDLFDTSSFNITADDLVSQQFFNNTLNPADVEANKEYLVDYEYNNGVFSVKKKTDLDAMPNIFGETKTVNIRPFWGDKESNEIGITRCDFLINYDYVPTAIFFGSVLYTNNNYFIEPDYTLSNNFVTNNFEERDDIVTSAILRPDVDEDIRPAKELKIVVYRKDDDLTPGSRKRVGIFSGVKEGSGIFRINLPMYENFYTMNEFGEIIPTTEEGVGIPTTGRYSFEFFDDNEVTNGRRNGFGTYEAYLSPGFRVPANKTTGDRYLGGWGGTWNDESFFQYDIINTKQKYYTVKIKFRPHNEDDLRFDGTNLDYLPVLPNSGSTDYSRFYNFPIDPLEFNSTQKPEVIGCLYSPHFHLRSQQAQWNENEIEVFFPDELTNKGFTDISTNNVIIKKYEWLQGVGVRLNGENRGDEYELLFGGLNNLGNENDTYYFGDNPKDGVDEGFTHAWAIKLASNKWAEGRNTNEIHKRYNLAVHEDHTIGLFISSTDYAGNNIFAETGIVDVTEDMEKLIRDGVYSSFEKGNKSEKHKYNGEYYYFGKERSKNALYYLEQTYFGNE